MAKITISLPGSLQSWVETQTRTGHYSNASEYLSQLIRRDQEHGDLVRELQRLITEGFESGAGTRSMDDILEAARKVSPVQGHDL